MPENTITTEHLQKFLIRLELAERSESTVESYMRVAREFSDWLGGS